MMYDVMDLHVMLLFIFCLKWLEIICYWLTKLLLKTFVYGDLYRYDVEKSEWKVVSSPNSPPPRSAHQAVAWKNHLYIFGKLAFWLVYRFLVISLNVVSSSFFFPCRWWVYFPKSRAVPSLQGNCPPFSFPFPSPSLSILWECPLVFFLIQLCCWGGDKDPKSQFWHLILSLCWLSAWDWSILVWILDGLHRTEWSQRMTGYDHKK